MRMNDIFERKRVCLVIDLARLCPFHIYQHVLSVGWIDEKEKREE
jgi:hypothetical protein